MRKKIILELLLVTVIAIVAARICFFLGFLPVFKNFSGTIFAVIFIYVPVLVLWLKKRRIDFLDDRASDYWRSVKYFLVISTIIFPLFILVAHFWQTIVMGRSFVGFSLPQHIFTIIAYNVLLVALPEEFFFRGYFQSTLKSVSVPKWRILGADLGWWWPITAAVFALSHSLVTFQWWHFSIFFPALVFGWLRERTGSITSPVLFHALSNVMMAIFLGWYR